MRARMVHTRVLAGLAASVVLAGGATLLKRGDRSVHVASVRRGSLQVTVACPGRLEPPPGGELRAVDAATVAAILVQDGSAVRAGEPLVRLDSPDLVMRDREAREGLAQLEADAVAARGELEQARRTAVLRRQRLESDQRLVRANAIPIASLEQSRLASAEADATLRAAQARVEALVDGSGGQRTRLALARERAQALGARLSALTVRAPAAGVVYGLPRDVGEAVVAGQLVASVTDPRRPRLRLRLDEPDVPRVHPGQRILVSFDGLPDRSFDGTVTSVARDLRQEDGRDVGEALGEIRDPDRRLPLNASVNVGIVVGERAAALLVPRSALQRVADERSVLLVQDGRATRRRVEVGLVGSVDAEIVGGLAEGARVILPGAATVADGDAVVVVP